MSESVAKMTLGKALAKEIEDRGITRDEASRILGTSGANVSRWIRQAATPEPPLHDALMKFLRVTKSELAVLIVNSMTEQWEMRR